MKNAMKKTVEPVEKPSFAMTYDKSKAIKTPEGRKQEETLPELITGFIACGEHLQKLGYAKAVKEYLETGTMTLGKEAGVRACLLTGYMCKADLEKGSRKQTTLANKGYTGSGRSYSKHRDNMMRPVGYVGTNDDGFKGGYFIAEYPISIAAERDYLLSIGYTGVADITTFPVMRYLLLEAGHQFKSVPSVDTDNK